MYELNQWDFTEEFSAEQLAALICGVDPRHLHTSDDYRILEPILPRIKADFQRACSMVEFKFAVAKSGKKPNINLAELYRSPDSGLFSSDLINALDNYSFLNDKDLVINWISEHQHQVEYQLFPRESIVKWLKEEGLNSKYAFAINNKSSISNLPAGKWPWGDYTTNDLDILAAAAAEFWIKYDPADPSSAPKSAVVEDWLINTHKVAEERAQYMASLLRADGLPSGRRPRRKPR